jgi:hypothetical protein
MTSSRCPEQPNTTERQHMPSTWHPGHKDH